MNQLGRACQIWPIYERVCGACGGWAAGGGRGGAAGGNFRGFHGVFENPLCRGLKASGTLSGRQPPSAVT